MELDTFTTHTPTHAYAYARANDEMRKLYITHEGESNGNYQLVRQEKDDAMASIMLTLANPACLSPTHPPYQRRALAAVHIRLDAHEHLSGPAAHQSICICICNGGNTITSDSKQINEIPKCRLARRWKCCLMAMWLLQKGWNMPRRILAHA